MSLAFARIHYRWCRTVSTKSESCKLLTSFAKLPVILIWDHRRWVYISNPVSTPCGRHSAQLLVDGELYPCEDFTIVTGMFEVNIYSKDSSSDEEKHLIASVPSKKVEFVLRPAEDDDLTPEKSKNHFVRYSENQVGVNDTKEENVTLLSMRDSGIQFGSSEAQEYSHHASSGNFTPETATETSESGSQITSMIWSTAKTYGTSGNVKENMKNEQILLESTTPTMISTHIPLIFTSSEQTPPFYFFGENSPIVENYSPFTWSKEKITEIVAEINEDDSIDNKKVSSPRKYMKKSLEVESKPEKTLTSIEKTLAISRNDVPLGSGTETLVELEVTGHQLSTNMTSVYLVDEGAQTTTHYCDSKDETIETAVQTGNSLVESIKTKDLENNIKLEDDTDDEDDEKGWLDSENMKQDTFQQSLDPQLVCNKLNKILNDNDTNENFMPLLVGKQSLSPESTVGESSIDNSAEKEDFEEVEEILLASDDAHVVNITNDQKDYEIEEIVIPNGEFQKGYQHGFYQCTEPINSEGIHVIDEYKPGISQSAMTKDDEESLESIKDRVGKREKQVRQLQQEIILLEDSHRHLYKERDQLLKGAKTEKLQLVEDERKDSLIKEVAMLRSHVKDQEKTNADLEWEVQALRTRLDSNDPTEVSQLIVEMRSLRDELTTLTKRNRDLYNEIVNLRDENVQLKCRQNSESIPDDRVNDSANIIPDHTISLHHQPLDSSQFPRRSQNNIKSYGKKAHNKSLVEDSVSDYSSDSHETEYRDFPKRLSRKRISNKIPRTLSVAQKLHVLNAYSPKCVSAEDLTEDKRSLGIQTLITALETEPKPQFTSTPTKLDSSSTFRPDVTEQLPTRKSRTYHIRQKSRSSRCLTRTSASSGSSTDSLLDEADLLIRDTMNNLLDGVRSTSHSKTQSPTKKYARKTTQLADTALSVTKPHGGSGDHVRTVSYHATPFIPKMDTDLQEGYTVKFFHPMGGIAEGVVKYIGPLQDSLSGCYIGIELFQRNADTNGVLNEKQFFQCEADKGIFVPLRKIILAWR